MYIHARTLFSSLPDAVHQACATYSPLKDFLWPMSDFLKLNNKGKFLEHFISKFKHNTQSASETSFLSV
jgi:hypothetical protein